MAESRRNYIPVNSSGAKKKKGVQKKVNWKERKDKFDPRTVKYTYSLIYLGYNTIYIVNHFDPT